MVFRLTTCRLGRNGSGESASGGIQRGLGTEFGPNSLRAGLGQRMMRERKVCVPEYKQNRAPREELKSKERRIAPGSFAQSLVNFV